MIKKNDIILALISGALFVPGFPPFDLYPIAWIAIVPLLMALQGKNLKSSFLIGLLTGFVYFAGTMYWVFNSMYSYGNIPAGLCVLFVILLCTILGAYVGLFSLLYRYVSSKSPVPAFITVPVIWVSLEFVRTYAFSGLPWSSLGYSQYKFLPLIQIADITGIYGVSFIVAAFNGAVFDLITYRQNKAVDSVPAAGWPQLLSLPLCIAIGIICIFYGNSKLKESDNSRKIVVSVVQGNIDQGKKWDRMFQMEVIDTYKRLSLDALKGSPDMIVWPETAVPFIFGTDEIPTEEITEFQKGLGLHLLFGSVLKRGSSMSQLSNSVVLMSPEGEVLSTYDKMHLVPYGEYVPFRKFLPFINKLVAQVGDFIIGKETVVMETPFAKIGNLICYEIIFPGMVREFVAKGANVLVTITNDAWFGRTPAPYQHFSMAVFRAIENRVPVVRSANTGISGFIDAKGRVIDKSGIFVEAVLTEEIAIGDEKSFYSRNGDLFAYICAAGLLLLVVLRKWNKD